MQIFYFKSNSRVHVEETYDDGEVSFMDIDETIEPEFEEVNVRNFDNWI